MVYGMRDYGLSAEVLGARPLPAMSTETAGSCAGTVTFSEQWPVDGGTSPLASRQTFAPEVGHFRLNASEAAQFRTFWKHLERARPWPLCCSRRSGWR
jgi:hypothetical protein